MAKPQKKNIIAQKTFVFQKPDYRFPLLVAIAAFALYANTLKHDYAFDDSIVIVNNQYVQQGFAGIGGILQADLWHFANLTLGYYRPLSQITFAIEHQFFGSNPHISHLINVLLYALTGFMICLLLMDLFSGYQRMFAFLICLLFIAHPVHTEVVANLKSRDEIMSFLGVVCMLFIMFRYEGSKSKRYLIISLVIFYLALLSKETAMTGAVLLPLTFYFFKQKSIAESIRKTIPFILAIVLFYIQKYEIVGPAPAQSFNELSNYPYIHTKFASSMVIFMYCLKLFIFPHPLIYDYSYNQIPASSWSNPLALIGLVVFGGLIYLAIKGFIQKQLWGFALAVFFVTLTPALFFVWLRGGIMAERILYSSSLGFCIALVYFLGRWKQEAGSGSVGTPNSLKRTPAEKSVHNFQLPTSNFRLPSFIIAVVFFLYSFKTIDRNKAWKDNFALFSTDVANAPNNCPVNRCYGHVMMEKFFAEKDSVKKKEYFQEAVFHLHKATAIYPKGGEAWSDLGWAYNDGIFIPDSAIYFYRMSISVTPAAFINYNNLGVVYERLRKYKLASYYFNKALDINPGYTSAQKNVAKYKKAGIDVHQYPGGEDPSLDNLQ